MKSIKTKIYHHLYFYVLIAIVIGVVIGIEQPQIGISLKILSDLFIRMIKLIIGPLIFLTVTIGIAGIQDLKKVGKIGIKAILYFEVLTTLALLIGLLVVNILKPGAGMNIDISTLDASEASKYTTQKTNLQDFIYKIIPSNILDPFLNGEILQVLFLAIFTGVAITSLKSHSAKIVQVLEVASKILFKIISYLMYLAPLGALGAIAFTVGQYGVGSLVSLGKLMICVYLTCIVFIVFVLGAVSKISGFSIFKFIQYIKNEILIVLGTSSSESVLPAIMEKMEKLGCSKAVTGLVIPTGYSFNLDGTSIYLTMAAVFIAQATNTPFPLEQQLLLVLLLMVTSKGAAAVTGGGLVTLAATLAAMDSLPLAGITLLVGIDRFMSEARAITNLIGNGVATVVISNWEKETDVETMKKELS
jgi:aerobic C4-dicarboxylate transport protein